jgi:hypothetical protein
MVDPVDVRGTDDPYRDRIANHVTEEADDGGAQSG